MKHIFTLLGIASLAFLFTGNVAHTNSSGAPAGKTGSPGDGGSSCNNAYCHGYGSQNSGEYVEIFVVLPLSSVDTYRIRVEAGNSGNFQYEKAGFQACVEDGSGNKLGQIFTVSNTLTQIVEQDYITHTELGTAPSSQSDNSTHMWEFDWLPPADFIGEATVYAASMLTNNNGMNTGDVHVTANHVFNVGLGLDQGDTFEFTVFPNPTSEQINMSWDTPLGENTRISLYDMKGAESVLFEGTLNDLTYTMVLPSHLAKGLYTIIVDSERDSSSRKIVLQ
jgi:hypothetical protein